MKLLVIQEQHFVRMPNGEVWVDEQSDTKFWERYLKVFDEIVVCARFRRFDDYNTTGLIRSDRERVSFVELPNTRGVLSLIKSSAIIGFRMYKAIMECDRIILRAPSPISLVAYPLIKFSKKPFAVEIMNNPRTHFSTVSMKHFYQPIIQKLTVCHTKSLCRTANGVSYVTENVLQKLYPSMSRIKGETNQYFESHYSTIRIERYMYSFDDWPERRPPIVTLVHVGKMQDERKGQDIFIMVINALLRRGYNVKGILVGDGVCRERFELLGKRLGITEYLDFVGWKAGFEDVQKELKKAQIGVFPSRGEGLPRSVIEGMSQGLLCVGTDIDGISELLTGNCLVAKPSPELFADSIQYYLNNWGDLLMERRKQFNKSKEYEYTILEKRRTAFYKKLKNVQFN